MLQKLVDEENETIMIIALRGAVLDTLLKIANVKVINLIRFIRDSKWLNSIA